MQINCKLCCFLFFFYMEAIDTHSKKIVHFLNFVLMISFVYPSHCSRKELFFKVLLEKTSRCADVREI